MTTPTITTEKPLAIQFPVDLRDCFAVVALHAILSEECDRVADALKDGHSIYFESYGRWSYQFADAMLAERERKQP